MTAYVVGEAEIVNPLEMKKYAPMVAAAVEKFGGRYLARGSQAEVFEGAPGHKFLIIEFPSADVARAWFASPEYAAAKKVRKGNSNLRLVLVEGKD